MADKDDTTLEDEGTEEQMPKRRLRRRRKTASVEEELDMQKGRRSLRKRRKEKKLSKRDLELQEKEVSQGRLWLKQNWKTMLALFLIFLFGLFLRSYFYYPPATEDGFILSGNDPYYHKRVADYVQENHHHLIYDPLLSYPDGALNPRPPMFDWSVAILGMLLAPLFGGDVGVSTWQVMEFSPAFWGALTAVPVYLIGKEMFNRKTGLICAFLLATMPSHVERSPLGFSDHDAIVLFFVVFTFFFFIKALNSLVIRDKWVVNWMHPKDIPQGLKEWFKYNQVSVAFSLLSGLSLASVALIWKGFLYPVVIIIVYFFIQMILNKLRNKDSLGVALCTIMTLAVVAFLPLPYYHGNSLVSVIEPATEILIAVIIISAVLVPTRDSPWLLVFSTLAAVLICGLLLLIYVFPEIGSTYFSGQGYFTKTKIFSTIAEAQAPDYSRAVFSYGVVTTFLALYGLLISIVRVAKDLKAHYLFMTIWGVTAVYMAVSATRFIFNAGPIFAILSGWMIYDLVKKLDFRKMMKHYRSLKGGGRFYAMKKSVKVSHIVGVLFLAFLIFLPNVWLGWDAGVPFGGKKDVDVAVYDALPWFMKPEEYDSEQAGNRTLYPKGVGTMYNRTNQNELKYFGAFGHGFPSDYWLDSMRWLSEQDQDLPIEKRPAFISWWDYGFWAIYLGEHPTAADNFQGRVQFAGSFISSQNESQAISLLIARTLEADQADYKEERGKYRFHEDVRTILNRYFGEEKATEIEDVVVSPWKYRDEVLDNPDRYGHYSSDLVDVTLIYAVLQTWIPELLSDDERVWLLHELQEETGYSLRYFAIDSRLFPFGPQQTGIYYAPLKLSDHRISENNEPYDFLQTFIIGSDSREYTIEAFRNARENNPNLEIREYKLKYYEPFLESMLLKCYIGYTLNDIGAVDPGEAGTQPNIPGVHATNYPPMQAWMMKHFQIVYRTAYWNPYNTSEYKWHPDAWEAMEEKEANELVEKLESDGIDNDKNGQVDDRGEGGIVSSGLKSGVVYIKYYEGAFLNGTVTTSKGTPVSNVRVTVSDNYNVPHDSTLTDENGEYHLLAPEGNVTVEVSTGGFGEGEYVPYGVLTQVEETSLNKTNINISDDQVMRRKIDENGDGIWDYNIVQDFEIEANVLEGKLFWDDNSNDKYDEGTDHNISQAKVTVLNEDLDMEYSVETDENGTYILDNLSPGIHNISIEFLGHSIVFEETVSFETGQKETKDIGVKPAYLLGKVNSTAGDKFIEEEIRLLDKTNETTLILRTDSDGNYSFERLLPGNYTVHLNIDGFESYQKEFYLAEGNTSYINITLTPSMDVEGITTNTENGMIVQNVTIRFEGLEENEGIVKFGRSNETGFYTIDLKNGGYRILAKHDLGEATPYVYLGKVDAQGGVVAHDISLQKSTEVFGIVWADVNQNGTMEPYETRPRVRVSFENSNGKITATTNSSGYYRVYLPQGDYSVYASFASTKATYIKILDLTQFDSLEYNIELKGGQTLEGYVYHDVNKNDAREGTEGLSYALLTFTDLNGTDTKVVTDSAGHFSINLQKSENYSVLAEHFGFEPFYLDSMNVSDIAEQSDFKMTPLNITISGITLNETMPMGDVPISFNAVEGTGSENASIVSEPDGNYSLSLSPGEYHVIVDYNTTENGKPVRFLDDDTIYLEPGEGSKELNLDLIKNIKINGTVNGTTENVKIYFGALGEGGEAKVVTSENGSFEVFLGPDNYSVRVNHKVDDNTYYVFLNNFNFAESQTIQLNVSLGVKFKSVVTYKGQPVDQMEVTFTNNGSLTFTTDTLGYPKEAFLIPNRTYEVKINQTQEAGPTLIRSTFFGILEVNDTDITNWNITITNHVKTKGAVYFDWDDDKIVDPGESVDNITIRFENGTDVITLMTNSSGVYEAFLELDREYNVTLITDFPIVDEEYNFTPTTTETQKDFSIMPGNLTVSGKTLRNGTAEDYTALWLWGISPGTANITTTSDANGEYNIELSYGQYTVYARKVSGSEVFVYLDEVTIKPRENLEIDINLIPGAKIKGKAYYINSTEENLSAQTQIDFEDIGKVSAFTNDNGQFEIWLPPGTYQTTADFSTFEYNMSMNYTYTKEVEVTDDMALYLALTKIKSYSVELEWIEGTAATIEQNGSVTYNISIKNTGNVGETFDISYSAPSDWNITIPSNLTLGIGESEIFEVQIKASPDAIVEHEEVTITAASRSAPENSDSVELKVNITHIHEAANMSLGTQPISARNNTLIYTLSIMNPGNGKDDFNLTLSGSPEDWNITLQQTDFSLAAGELKNFNLTIIIPYNTAERSATLILRARSSVNLTSTLEITVELPNLGIEEEDLTITGDQVSEGALNREPIPGFEVLALLASLIIAAFVIRRREAR